MVSTRFTDSSIQNILIMLFNAIHFLLKNPYSIVGWQKVLKSMLHALLLIINDCLMNYF